MKKKHGTLWSVFEEYPPYYVRILAKRPGSGLQDMWLTHEDIAISSGIQLSRVYDLSQSSNWLEFTLAEIFAFTLACNFDPARLADRCREKQYKYICKKRGVAPCQYLKMSPKYESQALPLLRLLKKKLMPNESTHISQTTR